MLEQNDEWSLNEHWLATLHQTAARVCPGALPRPRGRALRRGIGLCASCMRVPGLRVSAGEAVAARR